MTRIFALLGACPGGSAAARPGSAERDARIDFFRGLALFFIFVDHMHGNVLASFTLRNFGFADAAEVFVLLAGYASFLAYSRTFEKHGWWSGVAAVARRIRDLYLAHIVLLVVCVGGLFGLARALDCPAYLEHTNIMPVVDDSDRSGAH
jgi:hypothetical protein